MRTILFSIGPLHVYSYGLMIAIGLLAGYGLAWKTAEKMHCDRNHLDSILFTVLISGFLGSKFLYLLTNIPEIMQDPTFIFDSLGSGWVVYGGILGGILGGWIYAKKKGLNFLTYFDWAMPCLALAQGFGRIGCFLAGCCYGCQTKSWFHVIFPEGSLAPAGIPLVPTQLMSSAFDFLLCGVLLWLGHKKKWDGQLGAFYLVAYSFGRFIIEFFRGDLIRGSVGVLSTSQFISIFVFVAGIILMVYKHKQSEKK